jgi:hypothetical protein
MALQFLTISFAGRVIAGDCCVTIRSIPAIILAGAAAQSSWNTGSDGSPSCAGRIG